MGAVFPLAGNAAGLAKEELAGVQAAADFVNADGGVDGRRIVLDVRDLESGTDAPAVMTGLRADGATVVVGAYASALSIPASQAASDAGLVYWEAGAVADRLTGRGLPLVFRVGASGTNLGSNSAAFAAGELAPRLSKTAAQLRVAIVAADDDYARSVAEAAAATAASAGTPIVTRATYDLTIPDWPGVMAQLRDSRPDVVILASHIPDGVAFRKAMLAANLRVPALIGSTMAECDPDFAGDLGPDAIGIFASDRPTGGFQPSALGPAARALYARFAAEWIARADGSAGTGGTGRYGYSEPAASAPEYAITGPVEAGSSAAGPSEEGLSGFSAAWALFHDVLPAAARAGSLDAAGVAAAARSIDLPSGSLPNGAGVRFSAAPATLGQNERAAAVIWQWQAVRSYTFVWPPTYQTGDIGFVPLTR
ncbi:MAG TPA: ABC transporter substrate-binding protein [Candidatus Bathyarchaeia archaeon]|nr:ABC transporter substrate-binding protein [Candidatus Bathyarchaeia archaeon]